MLFINHDEDNTIENSKVYKLSDKQFRVTNHFKSAKDDQLCE